MKKHTVTIGIPAYNEAKTIASLLKDLLAQAEKSIDIASIIVVSDGSQDKTVAQTKSVKDDRITVVSGTQRKGKAFRQNELFRMSTSDILVILDADVRMKDPYTLEHLVAPIIKAKASLTSAEIYEAEPKAFLESILFISMQLKSILFSVLRQGNNVFHCHGPIRAFSRDLYSSFRFEVDEGEDMYSYFACISREKRFEYVPSVGVTYRLPNRFDDHKKQSSRYYHAKEIMKDLFPADVVEKEFSISLFTYIQAAMKALPFAVKNPLKTTLYVFLFLFMRVTDSDANKKEMWAALSTKTI